MGSKAELARLTEDQVVTSVSLTRDEAVAINTTKLASVEPAADGWTVRAAYAVGALRVGDLEVRVAPKVGTVQVLRLLARAYAVRDLTIDEQSLTVAAAPDLTAVLAELFAQEAATAMAEGPLRGYRSQEDTLPVLRGRLRIREQELRRFGQLAPLEVSFDEWTADTDENRRLRAATSRLLVLGGLPDLTRRRLLRLDRQLAGVTLTPAGATLPGWTPTRLNARLHALLGLADLVLAQESVEHRVGTVQVRGFVLSMALLFERLLTQLLSEAAPGLGIRIKGQRTDRLDDRGVFTIKPDLTVLRGQTVTGVADVKYKLLDEQGRFPNADAYQLVTYCTRLGLRVGHLIYAGGDPDPGPVRVLGSKVDLVAHAIDLGQPLDHVADSVTSLAHELSSGSD